jgi:hypothetical protein
MEQEADVARSQTVREKQEHRSQNDFFPQAYNFTKVTIHDREIT